MHFIEAARFLNPLVLAGSKVNVIYAPGLTARLLLPTTAVWALKQPLCSHLYKITNEPVDYMVLGPYDFAAGQRHYLGHWKGWAMKVSTFFGPNSSRLARAVSGPNCLSPASKS